MWIDSLLTGSCTENIEDIEKIETKNYHKLLNGVLNQKICCNIITLEKIKGGIRMEEKQELELESEKKNEKKSNKKKNSSNYTCNHIFRYYSKICCL